MAKIKGKMLPDITADKIIENDRRMFVSRQHIEVIENSLAPGSVIRQYDDTEIKNQLNETKTDAAKFENGLNSIVYSMLQNLMKYDIKEGIPANLTGYTFVDSLVNNSNIDSCVNCSYDTVNDKIK